MSYVPLWTVTIRFPDGSVMYEDWEAEDPDEAEEYAAEAWPEAVSVEVEDA